MSDMKDIPLLDVEWRLIEPKLRQSVEAETALTAYISIVAARAGDEGAAYILDIEKRALVPVYTKDQVDKKLAEKVNRIDLEKLTGEPHGDH